MSNSLTHSIYMTMMVEGAKIARTRWEKAFLIWLADQNQSVVGLGIVGFDVCELGWIKEDFVAQKQFLLQLLENVQANKTYAQHPIYLKEEFGEPRIAAIHSILAPLQVEDVSEHPRSYFSSQKAGKVEQCPIHEVYMNNLDEEQKYRCLLCEAELYAKQKPA